MLQTIREHTQGWIAGIVITILILSFSLWGIHSYFVGGASNTIVATVDGVEITKEQLAVAYERLRRQVQIQYGSSNASLIKDESALKSRALQALIDIEVMKQASLSQGFHISDRQVDNYLQSMPEFQIDGQFSVDRFQEILSSTMLTTGEFLELIRVSLLIDQPKLGILFTSFALPDETEYTISLVNQERDIAYINIPLQYFLMQPAIISPAQIQAYYNQHRNEFMTKEQVNVEYIQLSLSDLSKKINPTDTVLKNFYNENINAYTQAMEWKLKHIDIPLAQNASPEEVAKAQARMNAILELLDNGQDFSKLSLSYPPVETLSAEWMTLNQVPAELQKQTALLTQIGQLSQPMRTSKALVILKVIGIKPPAIQPFNEVLAKVKETYIRQHAEEKFAEAREQLADSTYEHPDTLQFSARLLSLPVKTSELFAKEKAGKDISQYKKVRDTAFSNDVLNLQNNSDVIQLNPETVIVLRVKSHIASTLLPLSGISKQIEDKLKAEEAQTRAASFAKILQAKLQAGADPQQLLAEYHLQWNNIGYIGRYTTKVDSAILDLAFRLPNPEAIKKSQIYGVTRVPNGYAVVQLKAVKNGQSSDKKQSAIFAEQVQNSDGLLEYTLYKQHQSAQAKVKILG